MKSWKTPTHEQVDRAVANLGRAEYYRYFFDKLKNPEWIEPLRTRGFFRAPPQSIHDRAAGTVAFPPWPESRYLARMASHKPELVADVIAKIPKTENARIIEDYGDAVLNMPTEVSAKLLSRIKEWLAAPYLFLFPEKIGKLGANLASHGQIELALELAERLLEVLPDNRKLDVADAQRAIPIPPRPRAHFDNWQYEQILKENYPELLKVAGVRALEVLCDLLNKCLSLSRLRTDAQPPEDYSTIWRPAIEDAGERYGSDIREILVSALRNSAEYLVCNGFSTLSEVLGVLERYTWGIYDRMAFHLLRRCSEKEPRLVARRIVDQAAFENSRIEREYALLIEDSFPLLSPQEQETVFSWIEKGPDIEKFKHRTKAWSGNEPTDESVNRFRKRWQCERLGWLRKHLHGPRQEHLEALAKEVGEPRTPGKIEPLATWAGPFSPKTADELKRMTVAAVVEFLREWMYPGNGKEPSPEGLGRILASVVSEFPGAYAKDASSFRNLDPTYVRALLSGLAGAAKENRPFAWDSVLELCTWVIRQPREIPGRNVTSYAEIDPHWGWTRKAIAELLSIGCDEGPCSLPSASRKAVWDIIEPLTDDPDPTPADESTFGGSNMDAATLSINTTRGEALHSVVQYARWIKRNLLRSQEPEGSKNVSFEDMPEVGRILDLHLNIEKDPSLAIRAVYGQWFPTLVYLDPAWSADRAALIFPEQESLLNYFDASWETYIVFCRPYDNVLEILMKSYAAAISHLEVSTAGRKIADPKERLAEHLMVYYWRGKLSMDSPERLLPGFWEKASPEVRGHALQFIGQVLHNSTAEELPEEVLTLSRSLWALRISVAKELQDRTKCAAEMEKFGWWFVCDKFDGHWALDQLLESLRIAGRTVPDDLVVAKLAKISSEHPGEAVECLRLLIEGDKDGWSIYRWPAAARLILANAMQTDEAPSAERVINYLGSRGYHEFRDLLRK